MEDRRQESTWPELSTIRLTSISWMTLSLPLTLQLPDNSMTSMVHTLFYIICKMIYIQLYIYNIYIYKESCLIFHLFRVIRGLLKGKCVILITHQLQFVQLSDNILAIKNVSLSSVNC